MKTQRIESSAWSKPIMTVVLLLCLLIPPLTASAQSTPIQASALNGELSNVSSAHYLSLEPSERDGTVTLTLRFGPQDDQRIAGRVGFWVLSASGLRDFQAGAKASDVAIAAGNPVSNKNDDYLRQASFTVVGRQNYTVIVYSRALSPASYTLSAEKAMLVDNSGQTHSTGDMQQATVASPNSATQSGATQGNASLPAEDATQKSGSIAGRGTQIYFTVKPDEKDGTITLNFDSDGQANGQVNFFVFDTNGLNDLAAGARPEAANLAAGNEVKSGETPLRASFTAVNTQSYTVMVMSRAANTVNFTLKVSGGKFQ